MNAYTTLVLRGDHRQMGQQHGHQVARLRPQIAEAIAARAAQLAEDGADTRFESLLSETRAVICEMDPPLLEMIRGQAEGLEFDFEELFRYHLVTYLRDDLVVRRTLESEGCTTWAAGGATTADGLPLLVKNRDYSQAHLPLQIVTHAFPDSGYAYQYVSSAGGPGVFSGGINEAGLAIADTHVFSSDLGPGLPDYGLMMEVLEKHDTVSSALDYFRGVPRFGRNNMIIADARGHLAVFESGNSRYGLFETWDGFLVNTNHFASAKMRDRFVGVDPPEARGRTYRRYDVVSQALSTGKGRIDVPFAQRLMASHDGPLSSICCHPEAATQATTISSTIFLPALRAMLFCHGLPCQGRYDGFALRPGDGARPRGVAHHPAFSRQGSLTQEELERWPNFD